MTAEKAYRPITLADLSGQEKAKKMLNIYIKAAKMKGETLDHALISGPSGCGKAQPIDTIIPTPDGYKRLRDIEIGDYVFDRCGNPTEVLGVFPQGMLDTYKITLADGRYTYCNNEHLWSVYVKGSKTLKTMTLQEMIDCGLKDGNQSRFKVPVNKRLYFSKKDFSVHPYIIGAFLGDGCCLERQLTISSDSEEIPCTIAAYLPEKYRAVPIKNCSNNYSWTFRLSSPYKHENGHVVEKIQTADLFAGMEESLCQDSYNKRIPEQYFYGSREQRLDLLRGLLDTDGHARNDHGRAGITFTSVNKNLVMDVIRLVRELGFYTGKISEDKRTKYKNGVAYSIRISCDDFMKPELFNLYRKKVTLEEAISTKKVHYDYSKMAVVSIEKMDYKSEMVCIYVDNEEHLYLTNDCIVTHNTTLANIIGHEMGHEIKVYSGPAIKTVQDITDILDSVQKDEIIFIDEIHSLKSKVQEVLYFSMEQFVLDVNIDGEAIRRPMPHFTLIGATTSLGGLEAPCRNRFPIQIELLPYDANSMMNIVKRSYAAMGIEIDDKCASIIGNCSRSTPRIANSYVRRVWDYALVMNDGKIDEETVYDALDMIGINKYGLNNMDMEYLRYLDSARKAVGIETLATALGTDKTSLEEVVEPYLIQRKFIMKGARGRSITQLGSQIVNEEE